MKPTFVAAVPRIFEKIYNKVVTGAKEAGGAKWAIFSWAFGVGREVSQLRLAGKEPTGLLALKHKVAHKLVFSKLQALFGGRLRFFISGSAPLAKTLGEFFHAAGILILEGYGLTETSAATCVNTPEQLRFGTVGPPLPGTRDPDRRGRRDPHQGPRRHARLPQPPRARPPRRSTRTAGSTPATSAHVEDGFLKITDRKKDLIKTSGGKYVAPQMLERQAQAVVCPYVSHVARPRRQPELRLDARRARPRGDHEVGRRPRARREELRRDRGLEGGPGRSSRPFIDEVNKDVSPAGSR